MDTPAPAPREHKLDPADNKLQISNKRESRFFTFLAKIYLKKFETIELHALGNAISLSVRVAETLERFKYAEITKIQQFTYFGEEGKEENERSRKVKMVVSLKRGADFAEKTTGIH